jgi:hypothetical protein
VANDRVQLDNALVHALCHIDALVLDGPTAAGVRLAWNHWVELARALFPQLDYDRWNAPVAEHQTGSRGVQSTVVRP